MVKLLVIDDDVKAHETLRMILSERYEVISAYMGKPGLEKVKAEDPDVVLLDIDMPDMNGLDVLKEIVLLPAPPPVIMFTVSGDVRLAVRAVKTGAYDFISKPYTLEILEASIWRAAQNSGLRKTHVPVNPVFDDFIGESAGIRAVKELVGKYACNDAPVIILGESGTGKEVVANALHRISLRHRGPFIAVNCGAIAETIVESELFGSEKGAFTGAINKPGHFEAAQGGSIFLDEIGEMSANAQAKLLRVLENKEITRVGGVEPVKLNIRIITATNKNLREQIRQQLFRSDLYYRLNVLPIEIPPLRERKDDIPLLITFFISRMTKEPKRLSPDALDKCMNHTWPGNVREMKNMLERAVILSDGEIIREGNIIFS